MIKEENQQDSDQVRLAATEESTVVAEYVPAERSSDEYQSEQALENNLIDLLVSQGYRRSTINSEDELVANLRSHVERVNDVVFSDAEWDRLMAEFISKKDDDVLAKTRRIQHERAMYTFTFDNGTNANIRLIDFDHPHNNVFEVLNQYRSRIDNGARHNNRFDVTILLNGLPIAHIELKKRGVILSQAFNQIDRYIRDSFSVGAKLFDYVHVFIISNGTLTKYYSNTTRSLHLKEKSGKGRNVKKSNSFKFTMWWADAKNNRISDLTDFAHTFLAQRTLFNIVGKYCVLDTNDILMIMRSYQIVATERIINKIKANINNPKVLGTIDSRGYVWHTTGSGKTLTSFKTAQLATKLDGVAKVVFVVDRQDLDYQTMKEYDKFAKGAANGNNSTKILHDQLLNDDVNIIVTTIQKLNHLARGSEKLSIYNKHVVFIFDECHRSQFGSMHKTISRTFKKTSMFGFTGTPIFHTIEDEQKRRSTTPVVETTEHVFGTRLHTYTIMDAIRDENVLPFNVQTYRTMQSAVAEDEEVPAIDRQKALESPERIGEIVAHILDMFPQHTNRKSVFRHMVQDYDARAYQEGRETERTARTVHGFNAMLATSSIPVAKLYYTEFARQQAELPPNKRLKIATIFSKSPGEVAIADDDGFIDDEEMSSDELSRDDRAFLGKAVEDYNKMFGCSYTIGDQQSFQNYYRDLSQRIKNREVDLTIVVNMFLTGFDATTLNTLYVDKNLRRHGLIQAFSRTNRILNSSKVAGNIVCYRNLNKQVEEAVQRFGDSDAYNVVVLKPFEDYYAQYQEAVERLKKTFTPGEIPLGNKAQREFVTMFTEVIRLVNTLDMFNEFVDDDTLSRRDMQDYQSVYLYLHEQMTSLDENGDPVDIVEDLEFEIQLVNKYAVDVDYILRLVDEMKDERGNLTDEELEQIKRAVNSSPKLRLKSKLIAAFIAQLDGDSVAEDFYILAAATFRDDIEKLIRDNRLKPAETRRFIRDGMSSGQVSASGMGAASIMPPIPRFGAAKKGFVPSKTEVIHKINELLQRYSDIVDPNEIEIEKK